MKCDFIEYESILHIFLYVLHFSRSFNFKIHNVFNNVSIYFSFFGRRALDGRMNRVNSGRQSKLKVGSSDCPLSKVATVCTLYYTALNTLTQLRLDILTGW